MLVTDFTRPLPCSVCQVYTRHPVRADIVSPSTFRACDERADEGKVTSKISMHTPSMATKADCPPSAQVRSTAPQHHRDIQPLSLLVCGFDGHATSDSPTRLVQPKTAAMRSATRSLIPTLHGSTVPRRTRPHTPRTGAGARLRIARYRYSVRGGSQGLCFLGLGCDARRWPRDSRPFEHRRNQGLSASCAPQGSRHSSSAGRAYGVVRPRCQARLDDLLPRPPRFGRKGEKARKRVIKMRNSS